MNSRGIGEESEGGRDDIEGEGGILELSVESELERGRGGEEKRGGEGVTGVEEEEEVNSGEEGRFCLTNG